MAPSSESSKQPEDRANYDSGKAIPADSKAKFSKDKQAWLSIPKRGAFEVKICQVKFEAGEYFYQVETKEGTLYKKGEWFPQQDLSEFY
ncbi:hypothetical protein B0J14DRAFT_585547 [Halenospora varia]|nr:hypothetical protein B0J14DRAFT_585547 [Halenospora varia]